MTKFDELKERFPNLIPVQELRSNVSIVELAVQYGYELQEHKGKSRPVLENPAYKDTIIIKNPQDASNQVYQRAGDFSDSGTVIDFIRNRLSTVFSKFNRANENEFKNITSVLYDYLRIDPNHVDQNRKRVATITAEPAPKQQFLLEQFDIRGLEKNNYLNRRQIAPETLERPEFATKVFSQIAYFNPSTGRTEPYPAVKANPDQHYLKFTNVAFPYYNGRSTDITGLELRSDNIKLHAPGSDRYSSVFISNIPEKTSQIYVMESAIDALSHQQLRNINGDNKFDSVYFSSGGQLTQNQVDAVIRYVSSFDKAPDWRLNLAFDNDTNGHRFDLLFIQQLIATKYPMSPTVGGLNRLTYLLPEQEIYKPIQDALLNRVSAYNVVVNAQFVNTDQDALGRKEMGDQQFMVTRSGSQIAISIPSNCGALSTISKDLLDLTGLSKRINIVKANGKDFNEDLTKHVEQAQRYRYSIKDETGQTQYSAKKATLLARTFSHLKTSGETEGVTKTYTLVERQPYGFQKVHGMLSLDKGQPTGGELSPEYKKLVQAEKSQQQSLPEKKAVNPHDKPIVNQNSDEKSRDPQIKPKR